MAWPAPATSCTGSHRRERPPGRVCLCPLPGLPILGLRPAAGQARRFVLLAARRIPSLAQGSPASGRCRGCTASLRSIGTPACPSAPPARTCTPCCGARRSPAAREAAADETELCAPRAQQPPTAIQLPASGRVGRLTAAMSSDGDDHFLTTDPSAAGSHGRRLVDGRERPLPLNSRKTRRPPPHRYPEVHDVRCGTATGPRPVV